MLEKKHIFILLPLILSLYSYRINYESEKIEFSNSIFSSLTIQNDSIKEKILLANKLYKKEEFSKALEISLFIAENANSIEDKIFIYDLIGSIFRNNNNHKKSIEYYKKILALNLLEDNFVYKNNFINGKFIMDIYFKLGSEFQLQSKIDSSLFFFDKVLKNNNLSPEGSLIKANTYNNLFSIYVEEDKYRDLEKAKKYIKKAIDIYKENEKIVKIAAGYGNLASLYMEEKKYTEAKKLYIDALDYLETLKTTEAVKYREALYYNLAWTLFNQKNYMSYHYLEKSVEIRDSINDIDLKKAIKEIETRNNVDLATKDVEAKRLLAEKLTIEAQRNTWLVGGVGIFSVLLLLFFMNYYKLRQRNLRLKLSENELAQQKNIEKIKTETQAKILNATLDGKETERKLIAETLHDNVSAMLSSANLHLKASQKQFKGEIPLELKKTQEIIKEASQQIRDLSHNLVSSVLLKFGLEYAVKDIAEKYSNSMLSIHVDVKNIKRYNQDLEIKVYNIIQELINNVIKHSSASNAYIKLYEEDTILNLFVKDDGVGFHKSEVVIKNSVGLNQIDARINMLKGSFFIKTKKGEGADVQISIPLKGLEKINNA